MADIVMEYRTALGALDKEKCVSLALNWLESEEHSFVDLYEDVLASALAEISDSEVDPRHQVWREHVQSAIVRATIELSYGAVLAERARTRPAGCGKALVFLPQGEQHELGARMVADYALLAGFDTLYLGADTPSHELYNIVENIDLRLLVCSVTNPYNLMAAREALAIAREKRPDLRIIVGGQAVSRNRHLFAGDSLVLVVETGRDFLSAVRGLCS